MRERRWRRDCSGEGGIGVSNFTFQILYPIWIGVLWNLIAIGLNLSCLGNYGPLASAWIKHAPKLMLGVWAVLICWSVLNGIRAS